MDSEDLTFDRETGGFQLRATPIGTARLTAPSAAAARVLVRLGWEVITTGPTDIEVRVTDTNFDVHVGGRTRRVEGLAGLAGWARTVGPGPLRRADPAEVTAALVQLTRFGPFFAVHLNQPDNAAPSVAERISSAAGRLGTQDRRVAASILFQGMAARLWSPVLGCLATIGIVPDLPAPTQWQLRDGGGGQPCVPHPGGWIATEDTDDVAALVERIVIRNVLQPSRWYCGCSMLPRWQAPPPSAPPASSATSAGAAAACTTGSPAAVVAATARWTAPQTSCTEPSLNRDGEPDKPAADR